MTVSELIDILRQQPQDAEVRGYIPGCGCCNSDEHYAYKSVEIEHLPDGPEQWVQKPPEWSGWYKAFPTKYNTLKGSNSTMQVRELVEPMYWGKDSSGNEVWATHEVRYFESHAGMEVSGVYSIVIEPSQD